jgi:predicted nucleic acid-binding protein
VTRIYWDSNLFIYLHEDHPEFGPLVRRAYEALIARNDTLCTSVFTVGEVLTLPLRMKDEAAITAIRDSMLSGEVELLPFTLPMAQRYGQIRAASSIKAADALHLATAIETRVNLFVTNDRKLQRLQVPEKPWTVGLDGKLF